MLPVSGPRSARPAIPVLLATAAAAAVLLLAAMAAMGAYHAAAARTAAADLQRQVEDDDLAGASDSLDRLQRHSAGVGFWLGGAPWTWLAHLPVVGPTLTASTTLAGATDAVVTPLAGSLIDVLDRGDGDVASLVDGLHAASPTLIEAGRSAVEAEPAVSGLQTDKVLWPFAGPIGSAQQQFHTVAEAATGMAGASVLLPGVFGVSGPTPWALVTSQPAEARGSGAGFFGAFGLMEGDRGQVRLVRSTPNNAVFDTPADLSVMPEEFRQLWGDSAAYIWGHNLTRHFPYAATLLHQTVAAVGQAPAYIVAVDPRVVAALLKLTGPVSAQGVTIDADTAEEYLTSGIYRQFPTGDQKDLVASALMAAVLEAWQSTDVSVPRLAAVLGEPIAQQRLVAWAADPSQEEVLSWTAIGGALPEPALELTASINNAAGNKLDVYLDSSVAVSLTGDCADTEQGRVELHLDLGAVPPGLPDYVVKGVNSPEGYGATRLLVHVYGPPGATLTAFTVDGQESLVQRGEELGRPVWGTTIELMPRQGKTVVATFEGRWPADEDLRFDPQPMVRDTTVEVRDGRTC